MPRKSRMIKVAEEKNIYKLPEVQLVNLSLKFPSEVMHVLSPLAAVLKYLNVPYPHCWIRLRKQSRFLNSNLDVFNFSKDWRRPGDFDIIAGPLSNGKPTNYIVGIEVKRFRYIIKNNRWVLIKPYSDGKEQALGYGYYGFNKVLLFHFVVAQPVQFADSENGAVWLDNDGLVNTAIDAVKRSCKVNYPAAELRGILEPART